MESSTDDADEAVDGFQSFTGQQEQPSQAQQRPPSKPSYAFVAVLTTLLLAYTNTSLTGVAQLQESELWYVLRYGQGLSISHCNPVPRRVAERSPESSAQWWQSRGPCDLGVPMRARCGT